MTTNETAVDVTTNANAPQPAPQTQATEPAETEDEGMPVYATKQEAESNPPDMTGRKRPLRVYGVCRPGQTEEECVCWTWARSTNHAKLTVTAADGYVAFVATKAPRQVTQEQVNAKVAAMTPEELMALLTPEQRAAFGIGQPTTPAPVEPTTEGKGKGRKGKGKADAA